MSSFLSKNKIGFTLVEVMVALMAGTIILILVLGASHSLSTSLATTETYRNLHNDIRHAMDLMQRDITRASDVTECLASNRLTVTTQEVGSGNQVNVAYHLSNHALFRTEATGSAKMLATNVSEVSFMLYDQAESSTTDPATAYFVEIAIRAETKAVLHTNKDISRTRIRLRRKGL